MGKIAARKLYLFIKILKIKYIDSWNENKMKKNINQSLILLKFIIYKLWEAAALKYQWFA